MRKPLHLYDASIDAYRHVTDLDVQIAQIHFNFAGLIQDLEIRRNKAVQEAMAKDEERKKRKAKGREKDRLR